MEAAVLNLAVMPEMVVDCNSNTLNAELEDAASSSSSRVSAPPYGLLLGRTGEYRWPEADAGSLEYLEPSVREDGEVGKGKVGKGDELAILDDLELLDLDSMCASSCEDSQETWLYNTQRSAESSDSALTPLQWCRQTLDSPKSELEATRRSLSLRLEQGRSLQCSLFSPQSSVDEEESVCVGFKLQDLTDVQVMARMQEESLRQELAFPARRSHSLSSFPLSAGAPPGREEEDDEEEDDEDYPVGRRNAQPAAPLCWIRLPHTGAGDGAGAGTGQYLRRPGYGPASDKLRRSMPNLVRAPSMPSVPLPPSPGASPRASPCLLRSSHSFDLSSGLSRLHSSIPAPAPLQSRVQSLGSFSTSRPTMKATLTSAPPSRAPPTRPRPPQCPPPAPGFLTPPKSLSTLSALRDSATCWRDGCY
ncbi:hypothetical protein WMY93_022741 [Mugilogobius chulae]|uniref:SLAIN motif family member 1 n=1 Tax=Mugilogobius chulae TaxID=88201 RepID=A0AAW0NDK6_9GOBI